MYALRDSLRLVPSTLSDIFDAEEALKPKKETKNTNRLATSGTE
jgi:hypothetical protein